MLLNFLNSVINEIYCKINNSNNIRKGEIGMEINEQKRQKFMENASKRVNNVMHNIQILEPMARSNAYDFTREDVEEMFLAMQETLDSTKNEFIKKLEGGSRVERKAFSFGQSNVINTLENKVVNSVANAIDNAAEVSDDALNTEEVVGDTDSITE